MKDLKGVQSSIEFSVSDSYVLFYLQGNSINSLEVLASNLSSHQTLD